MSCFECKNYNYDTGKPYNFIDSKYDVLLRIEKQKKGGER